MASDPRMTPAEPVLLPYVRLCLANARRQVERIDHDPGAILDTHSLTRLRVLDRYLGLAMDALRPAVPPPSAMSGKPLGLTFWLGVDA